MHDIYWYNLYVISCMNSNYYIMDLNITINSQRMYLNPFINQNQIMPTLKYFYLDLLIKINLFYHWHFQVFIIVKMLSYFIHIIEISYM